MSPDNKPPTAHEVLTGGTPVDPTLYEDYTGYYGPPHSVDYLPSLYGRYLYPTTTHPKCDNLTYSRGCHGAVNSEDRPVSKTRDKSRTKAVSKSTVNIEEEDDFDPVLYDLHLGQPVGDLTWKEFVSLYISISRLAITPSSPLAPYFSESEIDRKMEIYNALAASLLHAKYDKREEHDKRVNRAKRREPHKVVVFNKRKVRNER